MMDLRRKLALWLCPDLANPVLEASIEPTQTGPEKFQGDQSEYSHLLKLVGLLSKSLNRSEATISNKIFGHARLDAGDIDADAARKAREIMGFQ